jgi:Na+/H+ antiporter NhaD/arsenite permease-like protein
LAASGGAAMIAAMVTPAAYSLPWAAPFVGLVLTIALAPHFAPALWERNYGKAALAWSLAFAAPDLAERGAVATAAALLDTAVHQYLPFVLLLGTLYIVAGGLRITGAPHGTPGVNTALLALGTVMAGIIGTPGASLLMLRPVISANRHRRQTVHVFVFFILLVANVGGALTPLGNPPLFLGYLKGVPFFWPTVHLALPTATLAAGLLATFYAIERYLQRGGRGDAEHVLRDSETLGIEGGVNLVLLALALAAIMLRVFWTAAPVVTILGVGWNVADIATDLALLALGLASLALTRDATRIANDFAWGPMIEVGVLFAAMFVTLIPVTAMMAAGAQGPAAPLYARMMSGGVPVTAFFFGATGLLSAFLDNAPTYLVFFGLAGNDAARLAGPLGATLGAISAGACFFGGLTYLGNAPNLMVRAVVASHGLRMPGFFGYIAWAGICLVPWLMLIAAIYYH